MSNESTPRCSECHTIKAKRYLGSRSGLILCTRCYSRIKQREFRAKKLTGMSGESLMKFELRDGVISIGANLSRKELFAALAMQGLLGDRRTIDLLSHGSPGADEVQRRISQLAAEHADALIAELAKERP
jgi:hypothetical protein